MYMGPEQISGDQKIGPAVDRYSLAHIAFTLLVGKPYWHVERKAADGIFPFMMQLVKGAQVTASVRAAAYGVRLPEVFDTWFVKATALDASRRYDSASAMIADLAQVFGIATAVGSQTPLPRAPLSAMPVSLPSPMSLAPTLVKASSTDTASAGAVGQTAQTAVVPMMVRSDEPSLQPVSVNKPARPWVVPMSLLVVGVVGIAGAFLLWPDQKVPNASGSSEPSGTQQGATTSASMVPSAAEVAPVVSQTAPTNSSPLVSPANAASPVASNTATAPTNVLPRASATASSKPIRPKGKDVLDQY
jgi:hypothetical protein